MSDWTAVILSGGRGTRLGQGEKADVRVGGFTMLDRVIAGVPAGASVVVVGPRADTVRDVTFTLEEPRYGGPVAALAAALPLVSTANLAVVAVDMPEGPSLLGECVQRLESQVECEAVVPVDSSGRQQPLAAAYRAAALRRALSDVGQPSGRSLRDLMRHLSVLEWRLGPEHDVLVADVDTPEDLAGYRRRVGGSAS